SSATGVECGLGLRGVLVSDLLGHDASSWQMRLLFPQNKPPWLRQHYIQQSLRRHGPSNLFFRSLLSVFVARDVLATFRFVVGDIAKHVTALGSSSSIRLTRTPLSNMLLCP